MKELPEDLSQEFPEKLSKEFLGKLLELHSLKQIPGELEYSGEF